MRLASGDFIAFIDDDAIATPTWLEELVGVFEAEGPTCGGVAGLVVNENGPGRPVQSMNNTISDLGEPSRCRLAPSGFNDPDGDEFTYFMGANMAVRRDAILAAGGFDETYFVSISKTPTCRSRSSRPVTGYSTTPGRWCTTFPPRATTAAARSTRTTTWLHVTSCISP